METAKLVDDLLVNLKYQAARSPRSCFVVFSSREKHVEIVIDCVETVFQEAKSHRFEVLRLDQYLKSGDSQYAELTDLLSSCCFAVVILDGLRPNVLFEYGILKGLRKPCIVLLGHGATIDIQGFYSPDAGGLSPAPEIDMDRHFSDVKDRFYLRYDRNNPKQIRSMLLAAYKKLAKQIEDEFLHSMFPHKEVVEKELKAHLAEIVSVLTKSPDSHDERDARILDIAHSHVERIAAEHSVTLPPRYFATLAHSYANINVVDKAVAVIDGHISGVPEDATLLSDKAYILRRAGKLEDALAALDAAIRLRPKAEFLWHNKAITLDKLRRTEEAALCYKKAIVLDSGCALLHYHYGILLYEQKEFTSAVKELNRALRIRPMESGFLLWKAQALASSGQPAEARRTVETLLTKDPVNADAWFVLGRIEQSDAKALPCFQKAVQLDPKHSGALCSSAACLSNLGKCDEALRVFARMEELCPEHKSCETRVLNICRTFMKLGRPQDALDVCNEVLSKNSKTPGALTIKALCLAQTGRQGEALELFSAMLSASPADAELWYDQACTYALAKQPREAARSLQKAIAIDLRYWQMSQRDSDFTAVRRTKVFRDVFKTGRQKVRRKAPRDTANSEHGKDRRCPTRASSRRPNGRS
ncbi:MAG: tetratricopeptide repeat protein [Candidatus Eisenbacteria bacterium]|nr:tetratricopeptide repeat protein [Candidatus Eisenbacteria bacterium]